MSTDNDIVLKVENLSKVYRLGEVGTGTIAHDLNRAWARLRGKEDPLSKVGTTNDRTQSAQKGEYVKVLDNINFEVRKGEVLGIIGKNGAGKSTLLKVISQITSPTTGKIKAKGRIASLLEVGTGMHPEMTGKENVYLNGTILGMTKKEIDSKFDEIMDFAGCSKYADTPVKRYSSGMKVRLGFAVAAFLEPEILIVDEVLAVGDAEFQEKAIGKMKDIGSSGKRTVLFVSHNMASINKLCEKTIVLNKGRVEFIGDTEIAIDKYITTDGDDIIEENFVNSFNIEHELCFVELIEADSPNGKFEYDTNEYVFNVKLKILETIPELFLGVTIENTNGQTIMISSTDEVVPDPLLNLVGDHKLSFSFPGRVLKPGKYYVSFSLRTKRDKPFHKVERAIFFEVIDNKTERGIKNRYRSGSLVAPKFDYIIN